MLLDPRWSTSAGHQSSMEGTKVSCYQRRKELRLDMDGFCRFVRAQYPRSTAAHLASLIDVTVSTTEKWLSRQTRPSGDHLAALISVFGPEFLAVTVPATSEWATQRVKEERLAQLSQELIHLLAAE